MGRVQRRGACLQVLEFVRFKERLAASHARAVVYAELALHRLTSVRTPTPVNMLQVASVAADTCKSGLPAGAHLYCFLDNLLGARRDLMPLQSTSCTLSLWATCSGWCGAGLDVLRFNEDLSTRPAWLPPHSGSARLAIPSWWDQADALSVSGELQGLWPPHHISSATACSVRFRGGIHHGAASVLFV